MLGSFSLRKTYRQTATAQSAKMYISHAYLGTAATSVHKGKCAGPRDMGG